MGEGAQAIVRGGTAPLPPTVVTALSLVFAARKIEIICHQQLQILTF